MINSTAIKFRVDGVTPIVSRYGGVIPVVGATNYTQDLIIRATPGAAFQGKNVLPIMYLQPDDIILARKGPTDVYWIEAINTHGREKGQHEFLGTMCSHCGTKLNLTDVGMTCDNLSCKGRLVSRLAHAASQKALSLPGLENHDICKHIVECDETLRGVDNLFDVDFGNTSIDGRFLQSVYGTTRTNIAMLKRALTLETHEDVGANIGFRVMTALSIPGLSDEDARTIAAISGKMFSASAVDTVCEMLESLQYADFLVESGIQNRSAVNGIARGAKQLDGEIESISGYLRMGIW